MRSVSSDSNEMTSRMNELVLLGLVEVLDVVDEAALVHVALGHVLVAALVGDGESKPLVEERVLLEARSQGLVVELDGLERLGARPERDRRAGLIRGLALLERRGGHAVHEADAPYVPLLAHLDIELTRERVDDRNTDAVQTAGHRVGAAAELAAGVQDGEHDLDGRLLFLLVDVDRDAAAVVDDPNASRPCG